MSAQFHNPKRVAPSDRAGNQPSNLPINIAGASSHLERNSKILVGEGWWQMGKFCLFGENTAAQRHPHSLRFLNQRKGSSASVQKTKTACLETSRFPG